MSLEKQAKLIQLMGNLLANGFHLGEVINFLALSGLTEKPFVQKMRTGLANGQTLAEILESLGFSKDVVTQIDLVDFHGNLSGTMQLVEINLRKNLKVKKKLIEVATYPVLLLLFLIGIMFGLKNYLLPQLDTSGTNFATVLISHLPVIFLSGLGILSVLTGLAVARFRRRSALTSFYLLSKLPLLGSFVKLYLTAYFAREWGNLLAQGVDLRQIFQIMSAQKSRIFRETGLKMTQELNAGMNFEQSVKKKGIFMQELALIIEYGAMKDKLGLELAVYADECWAQFFSKIDRTMQLIQPVIFIFVALMIVLLYVAMLLPIYSNMSTMM